MVELQPCASLVNASALCAIEHEVKGEGTVINAIAEMSAELQREREKNAQLMQRISVLEAQIQGRDKETFVANGQDSCVNATERSLKKFKRQKVGTFQNANEERNISNGEFTSQINLGTQCNPPKDANVEDRLVNWMSMDETQFSHIDKLKDDDLAADCDDTDDSDEEEDGEEVDAHLDHKNGETYETVDQIDIHQHQKGVDEGTHTASLGNVFVRQDVPAFPCINQATSADREAYCILSDNEQARIKRDLQKQDNKETENIGYQKTPADHPVFKEEACQTGPVNISSTRKPPKVAFCPKEVKRILESEALLVKNAQSHTIRKIIVFASLGIRHGCEDMHELDFNHFTILKKGEPYVSPKDPGEHVLYENPGVRRKIFFPNRQNPILCPVQILEEEKDMRPSDPSCPSCLFLCIKYGGRTRNLPQNEYVRQRMGRNKLKSFGPVMCRRAMLVHIRNGSFFFKALGITLLFMAGFPDDWVQRETKYRNLDLLQKYYRTDEDAEGEKLFLSHPVPCDTQASPGLTGKTVSARSKGKKQANFISKPNNLPRSSVHQSLPSSPSPPAQFGLMGYTSIQTQATASFQSIPPQTPQNILQVPNRVINSSTTNVSYNNPTPYHMFPPQPANAFMPMVYWSAPNAFPPNPYASTYGYQAFSPSANYTSTYPHLYYIHPPCSSLIPKMTERNWQNDAVSEEADSDSDGSSSRTEPKEALPSYK
ncbi:uncharacterized protein LOC8284200 [Ricinus communis]|uniref:Homer protein n=1 Tax=Ricinus communis TaxID=3988 RepID=B9RXL4_RICCO|nr:uncharacterized protein LOC8284200 [Ricinus communis]EEF43870.1 conserved hypothetical protein [Ricinus communis]|eukprot:XP_002518483.1 uncharacterized protein LOC8284200 [Ricinus communis]